MAHSEKDKITAVSKLKQRVPILELCSTYNVCVRTIYRWAKEFPETNCKTAIPNKEVKSLRRRIDKLEKIVAILKAVDCTVHSPQKEKLTEFEKII